MTLNFNSMVTTSRLMTVFHLQSVEFHIARSKIPKIELFLGMMSIDMTYDLFILIDISIPMKEHTMN